MSDHLINVPTELYLSRSVSKKTRVLEAGVEGVSNSISLPSVKENTLDEPVSVTILRDLQLVDGKLRIVLMPSNTSEETLKALRDWDLWGPLLLCLTLYIMLCLTAPATQSAMVFTGVFVVIWVGAAIVTINAQLLGVPSRSSRAGVLGYCVFPLNIARVCLFSHIFLRVVIVSIGFFWSTRASVVFMSKLVPPKRKTLTVYPVLLFYLFLSWMVLIQ